MMTKAITIAFLTLVTYWSGVLGYWSSQRDLPVRVIGAEVLDPVTKPGARLRVRWNVDRLQSCALHLDRLIFDGQQVRYELADLNIEAAPGPLGISYYVTETPIPTAAFAGDGKYRLIASYRCNPVHYFWPVTSTTEVPFVIGKP